MLKHRALVAEFLQTNYDKFFEHYADLLQTKNYATLRQALKLLSELLLGRDNFAVLQKYISDEHNLKEIMKLLANESNVIRFESFQDEKRFLIKSIRELREPERPAGSSSIQPAP